MPQCQYRFLRFQLSCLVAYVNKTKFERNSSLEYYHITCIGKTKTYKLKSSSGFRNTYPLDSDSSSG